MRVGPREGKKSFGFHFLHDGLPFEVLIARICNLATRNLALHEWAIQFHAKPLAKFAVVRQRTPDPRERRLEFNTLLNTVIRHKQPPGCILIYAVRKCNRLVAFLWRRSLA